MGPALFCTPSAGNRHTCLRGCGPPGASSPSTSPSCGERRAISAIARLGIPEVSGIIVGMPTGTCRLCHNHDVDLRDSHFISSGFYKLARDGTRANPNPVLVSESVSIVSSDQATDYLLCAECEGRFNTGGEDWILKNCWHSESDFTLRAALLETAPSPLSTPGFTIFEGVAAAANEPDKLAYFAASIFWRGAAHDWVFMRQKPKRLELGPYEEQLRSYLLGTGVFPEDAVLVVAISSGMERLRNMLITFPFLKSREPGFRQYRFSIPGITFQLFLGKSIPFALRRLCSVRPPERHILMTEDVDDLNMKDGASLIAKTRKAGALAKPDRSKRAPTNAGNSQQRHGRSTTG